MSARRKVAGLEFPGPVLLAAGTAGFGVELAGIADLARLGGLVTKAVSLQPRAGNPAPRVAEFRGGMLNSVGLTNPGVLAARDRLLPELAGLPFPGRVLVNVVGFEEDEYAAVIRELDPLDCHDGYELNLSCPNTSAGGIEFGADAASVTAIVSSCRAETRRPIFAKLSPSLSNLEEIAAAVGAAGADGITAVNTMPGSLYRGDAHWLGNGFGGVSGPALRPVGLRAVERVRALLPEIAIIGVGGIGSAVDALDYLRAGADLVAIGTAGFADPRLPERVAMRLEELLG